MKDEITFGYWNHTFSKRQSWTYVLYLGAPRDKGVYTWRSDMSLLYLKGHKCVLLECTRETVNAHLSVIPFSQAP